MTFDEFESHIRQSGAVAFDTNAVWSIGTWARACKQLESWAAANSVALDLIVPALVHCEKLHDLRQQHGSEFRAKQVDQKLQSMNVRVVAFGKGAAEVTSVWLIAQHPNQAAWRSAKARAAARAFLAVSVPEPPPRCSATVDWFIAGQAAGKDWLLVTDDRRGGEFAAVVKKLKFETFRDYVARLGNVVATAAANDELGHGAA